MAPSNLLTLLSLALLTTASTTTNQLPFPPFLSPNPDSITIDQAQHSGNGCPRTSDAAVITVAADKSSVSISGYDATFRAAIGPNASQMDRQKNCNLMLHVSTAEPGWQFTVRETGWEGYARLDPGVVGTFFASFFFASAADKTVCFLVFFFSLCIRAGFG
jgi:hypothetical protein